METQSEYLERARAGFRIKSDAHIAREIGITPQYLHRFKHGEIQLGKEAMTALANRAGLDPDEALVLRALWASDIETIPNYASYLRKFAGCFLALALYGQENYALKDNPLILNDNITLTHVKTEQNNKHYAAFMEYIRHIFCTITLFAYGGMLWIISVFARLRIRSTLKPLVTSSRKAYASLPTSLKAAR